MRLVGLGTVILLSALAGCAPFQAYRSDMTHRYQACRAWRHHAHDCDPGEYPHDFAAGWKEGYLAVSSGSSGEIPPVPPEEYWKDRFRTPEGRVRVDSWFSGYQCGAIAADKDGVGQLAYIPVAPGAYQPAPPIWQPGEWKRPMPDQPSPEQPFQEQLPDGGEEGMVGVRLSRRWLRLLQSPRLNSQPQSPKFVHNRLRPQFRAWPPSRSPR